MSQPIIKRSQVQFSASQGPGGPVRLVHTEAAAHAQGQKSVRLLEENGRVQAIEFTCSCGSVTAVELTYPGEA